jgi:Rrf2 family protein
MDDDFAENRDRRLVSTEIQPDMKLTTKSEYALLALTYLARQDTSELVSGEQIAREQVIPQNYLRQILLNLKHAHYIHSTKGQHGGYRLAKPAASITLAEIVRLFDGPLAPTESVSTFFYESTPVEKEKKLTEVFRDIRDYVAGVLEKTTLADVL